MLADDLRALVRHVALLVALALVAAFGLATCTAYHRGLVAGRASVGDSIRQAEMVRVDVAHHHAVLRAQAESAAAVRATATADTLRGRIRRTAPDTLAVEIAPGQLVPITAPIPAIAVVVRQLAADSSAIVHWRGAYTAEHTARLASDSLVALWRAQDAADRARVPRCGWRCGALLAVGALVAVRVGWHLLRPP